MKILIIMFLLQEYNIKIDFKGIGVYCIHLANKRVQWWAFADTGRLRFSHLFTFGITVTVKGFGSCKTCYCFMLGLRPSADYLSMTPPTVYLINRKNYRYAIPFLRRIVNVYIFAKSVQNESIVGRLCLSVYPSTTLYPILLIRFRLKLVTSSFLILVRRGLI